MEFMSIANRATQGFNSVVDSATRLLTGAVEPIKPRTSLCQRTEPEFFSLPDTSLERRSIQRNTPDSSLFYSLASNDEFASLPPSPETSLEFHSLAPSESERSVTQNKPEQQSSDRDVETSIPQQNPTALAQTALNSQQAIRKSLNGSTEALFLNTLHQNCVLVAQFRQDQEHTIALIEARIDALNKDINISFSDLSPRKNQAREYIKGLRLQLETLKQNRDEESLNIMLDGIQRYETEFEKVSWLILSSLAFLNITESSGSSFTNTLRKLVPAELLTGNTADLLNPTTVCKLSRTITGSRHSQQELKNLQQQMVEASSHHVSNQKLGQLFQTLDLNIIGTPDQLKDPRQTMMRVIETQPQLAGKILANRFQDCDVDANPVIRNNGKVIQEMLATTPKEKGSEYLNHCLAKSGIDFDPILTETGGLIQKHYLYQKNEQIKQQTAALLDQKQIIAQQQYEEMTDHAKQLKTLAEELNYSTQTINIQIREMRKLTAQATINAMAEGEPLWHLGKTTHIDPAIHLQQVTDAIHGKDNLPHADAIRKLHALLPYANNERIHEYSEYLRKKDELLCSQRQTCLENARENLGDKIKFSHYSLKAQTLESLRPKPMLLNMMEGSASPSEVAMRLGRGVLTPFALPFVHQMKELNLMHELALKGYNFEDEAWDLLSYMPSVGSHLQSAGKQTYRDGHELVTKLKNMELSAVDTAREIAKLGSKTAERLTADFREILTGAAALGKTNPRLLRAVYGNLRQTLTVLGNTVGRNSTLYSWFSELHSRVSAEASTQYFIDNLDNEPVDLDKLSKEEMKAIKRLVTLNRLLTCGPYIPHVLNAALGIVQSNGNPISTTWAWAKAGLNIFYSRIVQKDINAMDGKDVQALNTLMDTLTEGPAYAVWRQQMMEQSGEFMADIACKRPKTAIITHLSFLEKLLPLNWLGPLAGPVKKFLGWFTIHPYRALGRRVNEAFQNWWQGKPGGRTELGIMALQCASVAVFPAIGLCSLFFATSIPGIIAAGASLIGSLLAAHGRAITVARYSGMTDIAIVVARHVHKHCNRPDIDFRDGADKMLKKTKYAQHVRYMAENHAFAALADGYWETWKTECHDNGAKADRARAKIIETVEHDFVNNKTQFNRLTQVRRALNYLNSRKNKPESITEDELKQILPPEDVPTLPATHHRIYWAQVMEERLHDEMFSAIGCDNNGQDSIPATEQELEARLKEFTAKRLCGAMLVSECAKARGNLRRHTELYSNRLIDRARNRTAVCMMKTVEHGMTIVQMERAAQYKGCKDGKINPEVFENAVDKDAQLEQAMRRYVNDVIMAVYRAANAFCQERLRQRLRDQQITDGQINQLLEQMNK